MTHLRIFIFLKELSLKEDLLGKMEESLENYKRKFAVIRHQKGLLYDEYINEKKVLTLGDI